MALATGRLALVLHTALIGVVFTYVALAPVGSPWNLLLGVTAAAPLLAALPGMLAGRRYTWQWLTIVLVLYVSGAVMEVTASDATLLASALLILALLHLALLMTLIRRNPPRGRPCAAARGRTES